MSVKMYAPFMKQAQEIRAMNGTPIAIAANGIVTVGEEDVLSLLKQGFSIAAGQGGGMPVSRHTVFTANANATLYGNSMAYGQFITLVASGGAAVTLTTATAANIIAAIPGAKSFDSWIARFVNLNSGNITIGPGANVTIYDANGNAANSVVPTNSTVDYHAYLDGSAAVIYWEIGRGNAV